MLGRIRIVDAWHLTGEKRYRAGWFGKVLVEVREERNCGWASGGPPNWTGSEFRWRDAKVDDFLSLMGTP